MITNITNIITSSKVAPLPGRTRPITQFGNWFQFPTAPTPVQNDQHKDERPDDDQHYDQFYGDQHYSDQHYGDQCCDANDDH